MKKLLFLILVLVNTVLAYSQRYTPGVLIGKKYKAVEKILYLQKNYALIAKTDSTLNYFNWVDDIYIEYHFIKIDGKRYCDVSSITLDYLSGEELIDSHINDWIEISNNKWLYKTNCYDLPLVVELKYIDNRKTFIYTHLGTNL